MDNLKFDLSKKYGKFKPLNATNGGPWHIRTAQTNWRSNFEDYKAARIPYSRSHDSALCEVYGGRYTYDVTSIFPNFDADPYNPESYEFACTDDKILTTLDAGTKTFFRLGQSIEHQIKKFGVVPPKDFKKWAVICEHIIRHYTEDFADGLNLDFEYWEIWNEPDLAMYGETCTWTGNKEQFFDFYETAAKHLKECFPYLKIGGPAVAGHPEFTEEFLKEMSARNVPIDFFSWHIYCAEPKSAYDFSEFVRNLLNKYGYGNAESILNEWNYIKNWQDGRQYSYEMIHSLKNASFITSMMCTAQKSTIDMLMYYDTRPTVYNGLFDIYTYKPLKGYYPFKWYSEFYDLENELRSETDPQNIYSLCGIDKEGKVTAMVTYYADDDNASEKEIEIDFGKNSKYEVYLLDDEHNAELTDTTDSLTFNMKVHSCLLIKEI